MGELLKDGFYFPIHNYGKIKLSPKVKIKPIAVRRRKRKQWHVLAFARISSFRLVCSEEIVCI